MTIRGPLSGTLGPLGPAGGGAGGFSDPFTGQTWQRQGAAVTGTAGGIEINNASEPVMLYEAPSTGMTAFLTTLAASGIWPMQEASGNALDASGNTRPLTQTGTVTHQAAGPSAAPAQLPYGMSGWSSANNLRSSNAAFARTGAFTAGCWVRTGTPTVAMVPIGKDGGPGGTTDRAWVLVLSATQPGKFSFYCFNGVGFTERVAATAIAADTWVHVAVVFAPGTGASAMRIYLNGVQTVANTGPASINAGTTPLTIGMRDLSGAASAWSGQIAGAFYVPSALTSAQIQQIASAGLFITSAASIWKLWYTAGWGTNYICYAESFDGVTWYKWPLNPLLTNLARPQVVKSGSTYYLYIAAAGALSINVYTSPDGVSLTGVGAVLPRGDSGAWDDVGVYNCSIIIDGATWRMLYDGFGHSGSYKVGYATSPDGLVWTKSGSNPVIQAAGGLGSAHLAKVGSTYWAWYLQSHGQAQTLPTNLSRARSADMVTWVEDPGPSMGQATADEGQLTAIGQIADPFVIEVGGVTRIYYTSGDDGLAGAGTYPFRIKMASFAGTMAQLLATREDALSADWTVRGGHALGVAGELVLAYGDTSWLTPTVVKASVFSRATYSYRFTAKTLAGATPTLLAVVAYLDDNNYAAFYTSGSGTTTFRERIAGSFGATTSVGANGACDGAYHDWRIDKGATTATLFVDGVQVGSPMTLSATFRVPTTVGLGVNATSAVIKSFSVR